MSVHAADPDRRPSLTSLLGGSDSAGRRPSLTKVKSVFSSIRRSSLGKNKSPPTSPDPKSPSTASVSTLSDVDSVSEASIVVPTRHLISSSSPASEIPQTWGEWNAAYQGGFLDFADPPPPPSDLFGSGYATSTGQHRAPTPLSERRRQRAVDNIQIINRAPQPKQDNSGSPRSAAPSDGPLSAKSFGSESSQASSATTSTAPSSVASSAAYEKTTPLACPMPKDQATHPAMLKMAQVAKERFGTGAATLSLMDSDKQVFLAQHGFVDEAQLPRESTICSHTMLRAAATGQKDPFVVLDIANDWRFKSNDFGDFTGGFYAAAPIMVPGALGDDEMQPAGIMCILDQKPRKNFSAEDRADLEELADLAGAEIMKWQDEQSKARKATVTKKREAWKRSKLVRRVSAKSSLEVVEEVATPPGSPDMAEGLSAEFQGLHTTLEGRRPSLVSIASDSTGSHVSSDLNLAVTEENPSFGRRSSDAQARKGSMAGLVSTIPSDVKAVLDLSVKLIAESLDLDFAYLAEISLDQFSSSPRPVDRAAIRLLSAHNQPLPAPLFDVELHRQTLTSSHRALLYTDPDFTGAEGEFSSGLLLKVAIGGDGVGYVLGAFTEDPRRVINVDDLAFCRTFSKDLAGWVVKL